MKFVVFLQAYNFPGIDRRRVSWRWLNPCVVGNYGQGHMRTLGWNHLVIWHRDIANLYLWCVFMWSYVYIMELRLNSASLPCYRIENKGGHSLQHPWGIFERREPCVKLSLSAPIPKPTNQGTHMFYWFRTRFFSNNKKMVGSWKTCLTY